jgi:multiple sugar transport system permease protein
VRRDDPRRTRQTVSPSQDDIVTAPAKSITSHASKRISRRLLPYLLSLPALLSCVAILVPFVVAVGFSLMRYRLNLPYLKGFIGLDNYRQFLGDSAFWNTTAISLVYTVLTVFLELLFGLAIALLLRKPTRLNNFVSIMLLLPLMTAPALAALMWKLMTNPNFGILSYLVGLAGFTNFKWASDPSTALLTVVLVDIWVYTPFIMILLLAGLRSLPQQPFEAAALDGVPKSFVFFRITLPMLMPYIITASLFRMLDAIQQFDIIYAMTQGGPGNKLMVFQVQAYLEFFQFTNVGRSAALLMVLWLITNVLSNIFIKNWLRLRERAHGHF